MGWDFYNMGMRLMSSISEVLESYKIPQYVFYALTEEEAVNKKVT